MIRALPTAADLGIDLARFHAQDEIDEPLADEHRRMKQVERMVRVAELLRRSRAWLMLEDLRQRLADVYGVNVCNRTIRRDMEFLDRLGCVEQSRFLTLTRTVAKWHWVQPFAFIGRCLDREGVQ
jgi:hypothetical protein